MTSTRPCPAATLVALAMIAAGPSRAPGRAAAAGRPNVVFILADDLGVHDLACYGRKEHATPNLDALAARGTRFTSAYCAQPICSPTRAAIVTGNSPARLKITTFLPGRGNASSQKLLQASIRP
jgi:arylsulfatase A-like enzyme